MDLNCKILSWNYQRYVEYNFPHIFKEYNREFKLDIVSSFEPHISSGKADAIIAKPSLPHSHRVEVMRFFMVFGLAEKTRLRWKFF